MFTIIWKIVSIFLIVYFAVAALIYFILGTSAVQGFPTWVKIIHTGLITLGGTYMVILFVKYEILGNDPSQ